MMSFRASVHEWPIGGDGRDWLHSDVRDVGYLHNHAIYDKFVEIGLLK